MAIVKSAESRAETAEIAALSMSGSSVLVATNALLLNRLRLPHQEDQPAATSKATAA